MKKIFSFLSISLITFLVFFLSMPKSVFADGMMIARDPYSDRWDYSGENNQQAFINYENGMQKMIISVGLEGKNSAGVVWLFPIPSDPHNIAVDVIKSLPQLNGEDISKKAKAKLDGMMKNLQVTQIYTFPFIFFSHSLHSAGSKAFDTNLGTQQDITENIDSVVVYEHLEKEGITTEIITAKTANTLYEYLKNKGLNVESGSIPVLDNYIGKDYSFVASWINSSEIFLSYDVIKSGLYNFLFKQFSTELPLYTVYNNLKQQYPNVTNYDLYYSKDEISKQFQEKMITAIRQNPSLINGLLDYETSDNSNQKGVFVSFPTKKIYFPLLPTSVYGSKVIPATIRVIGHVSPKIISSIESYTKTGYYIDYYANFTDDLKNFYSGHAEDDIKYTKIEINAPSKFLTDDLWINNHVPFKTYYSTFIGKHPTASTIILLLLSSIIAGLLIGMLVFQYLRKKPIKLCLIGLSNCLTLFALLITTIFIGTKNKNENVNLLIVESKKKKYYWKRKIAMILLIFAIPLLLFGLLAFPSLFNPITHTNSKYYIHYFGIPVLILYILPITALIISFIIKKIKVEDRNLFEQIKSFGYSSWTFQPKDKMKYAFVPLFSISFLIISWLLVKFMEFTV